MTLRIAIAGTGWAGTTHATAVRNTPGAELAAVVNHRPDSKQRFAEQFSVPRQYADVESLLAAGGVDVLVVATPNYLHAPQTIAALRARLHVLVEKPMALSVAQAMQMVEAGRAAGRFLMVGQCWRSDVEVRWLREQVAAGKLGEVVRTKSYGVHTNWGPSGWFTEKALAGGGALMDMGVHAIDTARFLLGDPQPASVCAYLSTRYGDYDVDDTGVLTITWANGTVSYVECGWWQPHMDGPEAASQLYGTGAFGSVFPTLLRVPAGAHQTKAEDPGHDRRYLLDSTKLRAELGWEPQVPLDQGLRDTILWYKANPQWWQPLLPRLSVDEGKWR